MRRFGERRQGVGQCRAVLERAEIPARAGGQAVPELVDRPQVDACGVECEAVPVIHPGVFAEAVQEDHRGSWLGGRPVPVVGAPTVVLDEWHARDYRRSPSSTSR